MTANRDRLGRGRRARRALAALTLALLVGSLFSGAATGLSDAAEPAPAVVLENPPAAAEEGQTPTFDFTVSGYASHVLAESPLAYYRLGEAPDPHDFTAHDASGNGHDGLYLPATTTDTETGPTRGQPGALAEGNRAVWFDGKNDVVSVPNDPALVGLEALTVEAWVKLERLSEPGGHQAIVTMYDSRSPEGVSYYLAEQDNGKLVFSILDDTSNYVWVLSESVQLSVGAFTHVAGVWDGGFTAGDFHLYVDGVEVPGVFTKEGEPQEMGATGLQTLNVGRFGPNSSGAAFGWLQGTLDEVAIFGTALSAFDREPEPSLSFGPGFPSCGTGGTLVPDSASIDNATSSGSFDCSFADGPATTEVEVRVRDAAGAESGTASQTVTVANVPPSVALSEANDVSVSEGSTHTYRYAIADPGQDTITATAAGCGSGTMVPGSDSAGDTSGSFACTFTEGPFPTFTVISARATDSDGDVGGDEQQVFIEPAPSDGCNAVWTGAAGDRDWRTAGNWQALAVPGAADVVCIPSGLGEIVFTGGSATVAGVRFLDGPAPAQLVVGGGSFTISGATEGGGSLDLEAGTLTLDGPTTVGELTVVNGTLGGSGDISLMDALTWLGGTIGGTGSLTVAPAATASFTGGAHTLGRSFVNHGAVTHDAGDVAVDTGAPQTTGTVAITNLGTWTVGGASEITVVAAGAGAATFANAAEGALVKVGSGVTTITGLLVDGDGALLVAAGELVVVAPAGQSNVIGGALTVDGALALVGEWTVDGSLAGGGVLAAGTDGAAGEVTFAGSPASSPDLALLARPDSSLHIERDLSVGVVSAGGDPSFVLTAPERTLTMRQLLTDPGAFIAGQGRYLIAGPVDRDLASVVSDANLLANVENHGFLKLSGSSGWGEIHGLHNHGTLQLEATEPLHLPFVDLTNHADGTLTKTGPAAATIDGPRIQQEGTLEALEGTMRLNTEIDGLAGEVLTGGVWIVRDGAGLTLPTAVTTLAAELFVDGSTARVTDAGGQDALASLGRIAGAGALRLGRDTLVATAALANEGLLALDPGARLGTNGDYTQTGSLQISVGGTTAAGHGSLGVDGSVSIAGSLDILTIPPFAPTSASVTILSASSVLLGTFADVTGADIGNGHVWTPVYDTAAAEVRLVVAEDQVPLPDIIDELEQGSDAIEESVPNWGSAFDLDDSAGFETPVVTDQLASSFDLVGALQDALPDPVQNPGSDLGHLLDGLEAQGAQIDWVTGGIGGRPSPPTANDLLQIRTTTTLADLAEAAGPAGEDVNEQMAGVLQGLASSFGLAGDLELHGDLVVTLVFGVDGDGFYLGPGTSLRLDVSASGAVTGDGDVAGSSGVAFAGSGDADLAVTLRFGSRLRAGQLGADPHTLLDPTGTGTARLNLSTTAGPLDLSWSSTHTVTTNGQQTSVGHEATLSGTLTLPQLTLTLDGAFDGASWHLHGTGEGATIDGLTLDQLVGNATLTPTTITGSFDGVAHVALGTGSEPSAINLHATFAGTRVHGTTELAVPDQALVVGGASLDLHEPTLTVTLDADTSVPSASLTATAHASSVTGALHGIVHFALTDLTLRIGAPASAHVFDVVETTATVPALGDVTVSIGGFHLNGDGTFGASSIDVDAGSLADELPLAGILPFDLDEISLAFPDHENLDQLTVTVAGSFDFPAMTALPFTPRISIGETAVTPSSSPAENHFSFSVALDALADGEFRPLDFGPIELGFDDLGIGRATIGGSFALGGYSNGVFTGDACGSLTLGGAIDVFEGEAEVDVCGELDTAAGTLDLVGSFSVSAKLGEVVEIEGATLDFGLGLAFSDRLAVTGPTLEGAHVDHVRVHFGEFVTLVSNDVQIPSFAPASGQPLVVFEGDAENPFQNPGVEVTFDGNIPLLDGWGGAAGNFAIDSDFTPTLLPGFYVSITVPPATKLGLPDFLPLHIDELGLKFPNVDLADLPAGGVPVTELADFTLRVSGGLHATDLWPISASLDGLEVDLGKLVRGEFPITNLTSFKLGMEPFELVPGFTIGGGLQLGTVHVDGQSVFYGRIFGEFEYQGIGAGVDLVVSQYGPVLAEVTVPVGVPLDGGLLGGILLAKVKGGVKFGGPPLPDPQSPKDILHDPAFDTSFPINDETIASAVGTAVEDHTFTWDDGFSLILGGTLTHAMAPAIVTADVTLGMNVGFGSTPTVKFIGKGDVKFMGMPFADAALLIDVSDPIAPRFDAAFESPAVGNPLGFLLPAKTEFEVKLDTKGMAAGVAAGLQVFVTKVADGAIVSGGQVFGAALETLAARLQADHTRPLAVLLLDTNGNRSVSATENGRTITRAFLIDRLLGRNGQVALLALGADRLPSNPAAAGATVSALLSDLIVAIGETVKSGQFQQDAAAILASFSAVLNQAVRDAGQAFLDQFDPKFMLRGVIQPVIFGIPLGQPDHSAEVLLTKNGLAFGFDTSVVDISKRIAEFAGAGPAVNLMALGFEDRLGLTVQLPLEGVPQRLLTGQGFGASDFDPLHGDWAVELRGGLAWNGFLVGGMTGLLFGPGDTALLDSRIQKRFLDPDQLVDPTRIPIASAQHYQDMVEHGGLLLTGRLFAPKLLTDPVALLSNLNLPFPSDPLEIPDWVTVMGERLGEVDEPATVQLYVPGLSGLIAPNFDAPTELERLNFTQSGQALEDALNEAFAAAYIEGTWNGKALSVPIGNGTMSTTSKGVDVTARIPLLGLTGTFGLDVHETAGRNGPVNLPRASTTVTLDSAQLNGVLAKFELPPVFSATNRSSATFRAYTPGYDTTSRDPLLRQGGIALDGHVAIENLVDDGNFHFAITPPATPSATPDFTASASVARLLPLAGVDISNATVEVVKAGTAVTVTVDGRAMIFGVGTRVHGTLASDLTGRLEVTFDGAKADLGGFGLEGTVQFDLTRTRGELVGTLNFDGRITLPTWLVSASGAASVNASGTISSGGDFDFALALTNFSFGRAGSVRIVGTGGSGPATFHLVRASGVTTVSVDGKLVLGERSELPLFAISGTLSSNGVGTLGIQFDSSGLNLSGFHVTGGAALSFDQGNFSIAVNGSLSVPNVLSNATASGVMDENGIQSLSVEAGSLTLPPLTLRNTTISLIRRSTKPPSYVLSVGTTADIPPLVAGLGISGELDSSGFGRLDVIGHSLTIGGFQITDGSFSVSRSAGGSSLSVGGSTSFLEQSLTDVHGSLALTGNGASGSLTVAVPGGGRLSVGGWSVGGTFKLAFDGANASFSIENGNVTVPGIGSVDVSGSLTSAGLGTLTITTGSPIRIGGPSSPFRVTGSFTLSRLGSPAVTTFSASNASLLWSGVTSFNVPTFEIRSNGQIDAVASAKTLTIGSFSLSLPSVRMHVGANLTDVWLRLGQSSLTVPGFSPLTVPPKNVFVSGLFSVTLVDTALSIGSLSVAGRIVFERAIPPKGGAPVFRLAIRKSTSGTWPRLVVPLLGDVTLNELFIASNGTFAVDARVGRIGPTPLSIRNAAISVRKTGTALSTFAVDIDGGQLFMPGIELPINLPDLTFSSSATFTKYLTAPAIDLGPAFRTSSASVRVRLLNGVLSFKLMAPVSVSVLADSGVVTLQEFTARSTGTFTGSVSGRLRLAGFRMSSSRTLNVSLQSGVVRLTLPPSNAVNVNLGFLTTKFSGYVKSSGGYHFHGTGTIGFDVLGFSLTGTGTFDLRHTGFNGSFSGTACAPAVGCKSASGSISKTGLITGTIGTGPKADHFTFSL